MNQFGATIGVADDGAVTVALDGELDMAVAPALRDVLTAAGSGARIVRVDLANVTFMDSSGLMAFITYGRELDLAGGRLQLADRSYQVDRLLEIAGLHATNPSFDVL